MPRPKMFRLGKTGLARVLGELESQVMEALWTGQGALSVQGICDSLGPASNYKTVMTVLNRLVGKGMLDRHREGRAFLYKPRVNRDEFRQSIAEGVVQGLMQDYGDVAVASFIDAMETASPETLAKLDDLLRQRRTQSLQEEEKHPSGGGKDE